MMKRREFIALLGGGAVAWPLAARAQQGERVRRVGAVMPFEGQDAGGQQLLAALRHRLEELGWTEGRGIQIDARWVGDHPERRRTHAAELVTLSPDVLFACFSAQLAALSRETQSVPIVFVGASDPVGTGH